MDFQSINANISAVGNYADCITAYDSIGWRSGVDFLIYTDASYEDSSDTGGLGAIVTDRFRFTTSTTRVDTICESIASESSIDRFRRPSIVFGLELTSVCWAAFSMDARLRGNNLLVFVDNNAALCSIAREASRVEVADGFVAALWWLISFRDIRIWFGMVSSKDNPADAPSRGIPFAHFEADRYEGFSCEGEWGALMDSISNSTAAPPLHPFPR